MIESSFNRRIPNDVALTLFLFGVAGPIVGIACWGLFTQGAEGVLAPLFVAFAIGILPSAGLPMVAILGLLPALAASITDIIARRRYRFGHAMAMTAAVAVLSECLALAGTGIGLRSELIFSALATALSCSMLAQWVRNQAAREAAKR